MRHPLARIGPGRSSRTSISMAKDQYDYCSKMSVNNEAETRRGHTGRSIVGQKQQKPMGTTHHVIDLTSSNLICRLLCSSGLQSGIYNGLRT